MKATEKQNGKAGSEAGSFCPLTSRELCENMIAGLLADQIENTEERLDFIQDVCIINAFEAVNNICKTDYKYIPQSRWIEKWKQMAESFISAHCPDITREEQERKERETDRAAGEKPEKKVVLIAEKGSVKCRKR